MISFRFYILTKFFSKVSLVNYFQKIFTADLKFPVSSVLSRVGSET